MPKGRGQSHVEPLLVCRIKVGAFKYHACLPMLHDSGDEIYTSCSGFAGVALLPREASNVSTLNRPRLVRPFAPAALLAEILLDHRHLSIMALRSLHSSTKNKPISSLDRIDG